MKEKDDSSDAVLDFRPCIGNYSSFSLHLDYATPETWLINSILQRTEDPRRYVVLIHNYQICYGDVMNMMEAIATSFKMRVNEQGNFYNPDDDQWKKEQRINTLLQSLNDTMTPEEQNVYKQLLEDQLLFST